MYYFILTTGLKFVVPEQRFSNRNEISSEHWFKTLNILVNCLLGCKPRKFGCQHSIFVYTGDHQVAISDPDK